MATVQPQPTAAAGEVGSARSLALSNPYMTGPT
jgi:hypothetical protein